MVKSICFISIDPFSERVASFDAIIAERMIKVNHFFRKKNFKDALLALDGTPYLLYNINNYILMAKKRRLFGGCGILLGKSGRIAGAGGERSKTVRLDVGFCDEKLEKIPIKSCFKPVFVLRLITRALQTNAKAKERRDRIAYSILSYSVDTIGNG